MVSSYQLEVLRTVRYMIMLEYTPAFSSRHIRMSIEHYASSEGLETVIGLAYVRECDYVREGLGKLQCRTTKPSWRLKLSFFEMRPPSVLT